MITASRRIGRPYVTLKSIIEEETVLVGKDLLTAMSDRKKWKEDFVNASLERSERSAASFLRQSRQSC